MALRILLFTSFHCLITSTVFSQDLLENVKQMNLASLWVSEKIAIEGGPETIDRPNALGFIGDNYQRFYIHFTHVIKNADAPLTYFVNGKTKVKNNVCDFSGTITIRKAYNTGLNEVDIESGFIQGDYAFYEDPSQKGTGSLKGTFLMQVEVKSSGELVYDAAFFGADGFSNNEFEGTWTSYSTQKSKTCNWGDFRIPKSEGLDNGAGEFFPTEAYISNGWSNYFILLTAGWDSDEYHKALAIEEEKWWLEK